MSVVIAIKDKSTGEIVVGCDSQVSCGNNKNKLTGQSTKIWRYNNLPSIVFGGVGALRDIQLIQTSHDLINELDIYKFNVDYEYCVNKLFTKIWEVLVSFNRVYKDPNGNLSNTIGSQFLLAFADKAFTFDYDGAVMEIDDYLVIGSGQDVAIGVLENNKSKSPKNRIKEAIKACSEKTLYVNDEVQILCTGDGISKNKLKDMLVNESR